MFHAKDDPNVPYHAPENSRSSQERDGNPLSVVGTTAQTSGQKILGADQEVLRVGLTMRNGV